MSLPATQRAAPGAWLAASVVLMAVVTVIDRLTPGYPLFVEFLVLGPALASIRLSPMTTGLLVIAAELTGLVLGRMKGDWGTADHWIAQSGIVLIGAASVLAAHTRVRRETSLEESESRRRLLLAGLPDIRDLESSLSVLRATLEATADGILVADGRGRIVMYNRKFLEMWSIPEEIATARDDEAALAHVTGQLADPEGFLRRVRELYAENPPESYDTIAFKDGRIIARYSQPQRSGDRIIGRVWSFRDITARRHAEEAGAHLQNRLERAAREWQVTFDAVHSAVLLLDASGRILRKNRAAADLLETGAPMASGDAIDESWAAEPLRTAAELVAQIRSTQADAMRPVEDPGGGRSWEVEVRRTPAGNGLAQHILVLIRDITGIVDLQQTLMRHESISAMGSLVAGVAHEVRNPLFTISASLDAFEARFGTSPDMNRYLTVLRGGVNRLSTLMVQLLDYGRPTPYFPIRTDFASLIGEAVETLAAEAAARDVTIDVRLPGDLPPLFIDRGRMVQVFQNLIRNAVQHSAAGDRVTITGRPVTEAGRLWIESTVEDTGPGIPEELLPRIFEPFFTRRQDGTGLGLSIVHRIVDQCGGQVIAFNRPGGGACLRVRIPLTQTEKGRTDVA